jgi:hypothetical protein
MPQKRRGRRNQGNLRPEEKDGFKGLIQAIVNVLASSPKVLSFAALVASGLTLRDGEKTEAL